MSQRRIAVDVIGDAGCVVNMRPAVGFVDDDTRGVKGCPGLKGVSLVAVGTPAVVGRHGMKEVLAAVGETLVGVDESGCLMAMGIGEGALTVRNRPERAVVSVSALGDNEALAVDAGGDYYRLTVADDHNSVDCCRLQAEGGLFVHAGVSMTAREDIAAMTLKGSYTGRDNRLDIDDTATVGSVVSRALMRACERLLSSGCVIGPVIARCVGRDRRGMAVLSTPPLLVHGEDGGSGMPVAGAVVTARDGNFNCVASSTLQLSGLSIRVGFTPDTPRQTVEMIDRVDVYMTPSLTALRPGQGVETVLSGYDGSSMRLSVYMPGITAVGAVGATRERVAGVLARLGMVERLVATVGGDELRQAGMGVTVRHYDTEAIGRQIERVDSCLCRVEAAPAGELAGMNISAGVMTRMGDYIVGGDVTVTPASGWSPGVFATAPSTLMAGAARGYTATTLTGVGGETQLAVAGYQAAEGRFEALNPLICYPGGCGREVVVCHTDMAGVVRKVTLPLTQTHDGSFSFYLADDLRPVSAVDVVETFVMPASTVKSSRYRGRVVVSPLEAPGRVVAEGDVTGTVVAVAELPGGSTLDFGRRRAVVMTTRGIYSLAINAAVTQLKTVLIDKRRASGGRCHTRAGSRLLIAAGNDIVAVDNYRVSTLCRAVDAVDMEQVRHTGEVWLRRGNGGVSVLTVDDVLYHRDDVAVERFVDTGSRTLALDGEGNIYCLDTETSTPPRHLRWRYSTPQALTGKVSSLFFDMAGEGLEGKIRVSADRGAGPSQSMLLVDVGIRGDLNEPLWVPVVSPRPPLRLNVDVDLSPAGNDFVFNNFTVTL